jgi:hypothetical protein
VAAQLLPLIPDDAFNFTPEPPEFEALAAAELGNAGSDSDGFHSLFEEAMRGLADGPAILAALQSDETEATGVQPGFEPGEEMQLVADIAAANDAGDVILSHFEADSGDPSTPPPPPDGGGTPTTPPATPGGGGSGGDSGFTGGGTTIGGQAPDLGPVVGSFFPTQRR